MPVVRAARALQIAAHLNRASEESHRAASIARLVYPAPDDPMRAAWEHMDTMRMFLQMAIELLLSECERDE